MSEAIPMDFIGFDNDLLNGAVGGVTGVRYGDPRQLNAEFYWRSIKDPAATVKANGRPKFKSVLYLRVKLPGETKQIQERPARDTDFEPDSPFYPHYLRFQHKNSKPASGTPLNEWPILTRTDVESLLAWGLRTIEELALLSEDKCAGDIELMSMRRKAQVFIEQSQGRDSAEVLVMENEQLTAQIETLTEQVDKLRATIELMGEKKHV